MDGTGPQGQTVGAKEGPIRGLAFSKDSVKVINWGGNSFWKWASVAHNTACWGNSFGRQMSYHDREKTDNFYSEEF